MKSERGDIVMESEDLIFERTRTEMKWNGRRAALQVPIRGEDQIYVFL